MKSKVKKGLLLLYLMSLIIACNTKIVATPSGDIIERTKGLESILISSFDERDLAQKINQALSDNKPVNSRELVKNEIDEDLIADHIITIYKGIIK